MPGLQVALQQPRVQPVESSRDFGSQPSFLTTKWSLGVVYALSLLPEALLLTYWKRTGKRVLVLTVRGGKLQRLVFVPRASGQEFLSLSVNTRTTDTL